MKRIAIIDNTVLAYAQELTQIDLLRQLNNLFETILIPAEVKNEFTYKNEKSQTSKRIAFIRNLKIDYGFYRLCNSYDLIVLSFATNLGGIDKGEAEAIAQARKRDVKLILTDDKKCTNVINEKYPDIKVLSTLSLISLLDIQQLIPNYVGCVLEFHKIMNFSSSGLREAYLSAAKFYSVNIPKKLLSNKTSLKKLMKNNETK